MRYTGLDGPGAARGCMNPDSMMGPARDRAARLVADSGLEHTSAGEISAQSLSVRARVLEPRSPRTLPTASAPEPPPPRRHAGSGGPLEARLLEFCVSDGAGSRGSPPTLDWNIPPLGKYLPPAPGPPGGGGLSVCPGPRAD